MVNKNEGEMSFEQSQKIIFERNDYIINLGKKNSSELFMGNGFYLFRGREVIKDMNRDDVREDFRGLYDKMHMPEIPKSYESVSTTEIDYFKPVNHTDNINIIKEMPVNFEEVVLEKGIRKSIDDIVSNGNPEGMSFQPKGRGSSATSLDVPERFNEFNITEEDNIEPQQYSFHSLE